MDYSEYKKLYKILEPCHSIDALDRYLVENFEIYLPWDIVDEKSTSSPLWFVWDMYNHMLTGEGNGRHVLACSRNSAKTLSASIIQYFSLLHFRRDGAHIAATISQAYAAVKYLDNLMNIPVLSAYRDKNNTREKKFINLPPNDFTARSVAGIQVITASKKGANAPRASCITYDELDLTPREIISEVAYVADPSIIFKTEPNKILNPNDPTSFDPNVWYKKTGETERRNAIHIYLSSRKSNSGPIQEKIDEAEDPKNKITLHMWSMVDWMEKCPEDVHKPDKPITAYMNTDSLKVVWGDEEFKNISPAQKDRFRAIPAYEGCIDCLAFAACQARSPNQRGTSPSLRTAEFVGDVLKAVGSAPAIIAQGLNEKPETAGLVFPTFERFKHHLSPIDFYEFMTGEIYNPYNFDELTYKEIFEKGSYEDLKKITPNKTKTYEAMINAGFVFTNGVDYGGVDTATSLLVGFNKKNRKIGVLHLEAETGHGNESWSDHVCLNIFPRFPFDHACPDVAAGGGSVVASFFRKHQIHAREVKPNRIETGVSQIRDALWDVTAQESRFAIYNDFDEGDGNLILVKNMEQWTHQKDPLGRYKLDKFMDDDNTHTIDALRYAIDEYYEYKIRGKVSVGTSGGAKNRHEVSIASAVGDSEAIQKAEQIKQNYLDQARVQMMEKFGFDPNPERKSVVKEEDSKKRKSVKFSFS